MNLKAVSGLSKGTQQRQPPYSVISTLHYQGGDTALPEEKRGGLYVQDDM